MARKQLTLTTTLTAASLVIASPLAFANEAKPTASSRITNPKASIVRVNTSSNSAAEEVPVISRQTSEDESPEPVDVVPVPTTSPSEPVNPTPEPSETENPEPTNPPEDESPEPVDVVPVPTTSPSEPVNPTPEPSETENPEPSPESTASPSETENAPVPAEAVAPTNAEPIAVSATEEAVPVVIDENQNIVISGTVTQEQVTETGETVVVAETTTTIGEQVTTEYAVNPTEGQTTVTQTVTNPVTGEKKVTERKVPATTFKAGSAANIATTSTSAKNSVAPVVLGAVVAVGFFLMGAGFILHRRQVKTLAS